MKVINLVEGYQAYMLDDGKLFLTWPNQQGDPFALRRVPGNPGIWEYREKDTDAWEHVYCKVNVSLNLRFTGRRIYAPCKPQRFKRVPRP